VQDERKSRQRDERMQVTTFSELRAQRSRRMCLLDRGYPPTGGSSAISFGFSCRKGVGKPMTAAAAAHGSAPTPRTNLVHEYEWCLLDNRIRHRRPLLLLRCWTGPRFTFAVSPTSKWWAQLGHVDFCLITSRLCFALTGGGPLRRRWRGGPLCG